MEIESKPAATPASALKPSCRKLAHSLAEMKVTFGRAATIVTVSYTPSTADSQRRSRKTLLLSGNTVCSRDSSAQLLGHFIDQPVQILVGLAGDIDLVDRMQHGGVMLAAKLASDLRQ